MATKRFTGPGVVNVTATGKRIVQHWRRLLAQQSCEWDEVVVSRRESVFHVNLPKGVTLTVKEF